MLPKSLQNLISELKKLPGIGPKSAERLAFYLLRTHRSNIKALGEAVLDIMEGIRLCTECFQVSEKPLCEVCDNPRRNHQLLCVVEDATDALAIENTHEYHGLYHILHGRISPLNKMLPKDLKIESLVKRVKKLREKNGDPEIILAMNPDMEGETTALYLAKLLKPMKIKVTRIARGLPVGSDLEYADQITLTRALEGRQIFLDEHSPHGAAID